jgi:hypothetical protein
MATTMGHPGGCRQGRRKPISAMNPPCPAWLIIVNVLDLSNGSNPLSLTGAACNPHQRFWPVRSSLQRRQRPQRAAYSSSPTRRTVMASTSAWLRAKNAERMPPAPIVSRGISPRLRPTGVSTRTKSRDRYPGPPATTATTPVAINTLPSPANAEGVCRGKIKGFSCHTGAPETT